MGPWGFIWIAISFVWTVSFVGIGIMRKLQPENTVIYAIWALGWSVAVTILAAVLQAAE